ncbi:MAG: DUF262 domain-containing protein [Selenomonadaceae bacterium]|nr:DUF262 domain-containing protein [Selenomonadaceae bacterium]
MAKQLSAEQKTISELLSKRGVKFLIPDYQRPYSWEREQCETLWDDITAFAFPFDHEFNSNNDQYFLGTILTFQNDSYQHEVIDGQQRLITFLLMLRAFYEAFENIQCANRENILSSIGQCVWHTDDFGNVNKTSVKLNSVIASDEDTTEFQKILVSGKSTQNNTSDYAKNYRDFQTWIKRFKETHPDKFSYLPMRILNNCILLPIEVDSQNTALRIFTTLNDRGMPLTDSDIFRAQFYKLFLQDGKQSKDDFIKRWKTLQELCNKNFHPRKGTKFDDLFRRYMYYAKTRRAVERKERISDTFSDQRDFYAENNYELLRDKEVYKDLETLAQFWDEVANRNDRFPPSVLRRLYVLSYSPYSLWSYVVSLYFMSWRDMDEEYFCQFLDKIMALILMNSLLDSGKQNIRRLFVLEFKNIYNGEPVKFEQYLQKESLIRSRLSEMKFSNSKPITRAMLAWWIFRNPLQELPPLGMDLHIEHIYAKNRHEFEPLRNPEILETLGNKSLLEKSINIGAADYRFADKKKYYLGWQPSGKGKKYQPATFNLELRRLAEMHDDFTEEDILARNEKIFDAFIEYLREQGLLF